MSHFVAQLIVCTAAFLIYCTPKSLAFCDFVLLYGTKSHAFNTINNFFEVIIPIINKFSLCALVITLYYCLPLIIVYVSGKL